MHNAQDAREVAQEAYVRLPQLDSPGALSFLRGYLFKIAENLAIDRIRHRALRVRAAYTEGLLFDELDEGSSPERNLLAQEELSRISTRLMDLPANCRQAFIMHVLLDRPTKDIAAEMEVSDRQIIALLCSIEIPTRCRARPRRTPQRRVTANHRSLGQGSSDGH